MEQGEIVRRYCFMTNGQVREVTVTKKRDTWSVFVDDKVAGSTTANSQTGAGPTQEYLLPFTVEVQVPGVDPLEAFVTIEYAAQIWNYMLCVNGTPVEPWWTVERGDSPNSQAPEVLGNAAPAGVWETPRTNQQLNAPRENLGNSLKNQQTANTSTTASGPSQKSSREPTDSIWGPGSQPYAAKGYEEDLTQEAELLPDFQRPQRSAGGSSIFGCCIPEIVTPRPRGAFKPNVEPEPCCGAPCCAPTTLHNRPIARTCHNAQIQCGHWAWELFG
mmetsp:Transcript_105208/g.202049  ORF Transcript_105208/g.202049 Transcript_105208/m.202049 type:complete len:274 (+) Transcript_105208:92-913(+)